VETTAAPPSGKGNKLLDSAKKAAPLCETKLLYSAKKRSCFILQKNMTSMLTKMDIEFARCGPVL
jgi:hypothetical protein